MSTIEFYNVKKKEKVQVDVKKVTKTKYEKEAKNGKLQVRYAFKAEDDGTKLTKFCSEADWKATDAPVV